MCFVITNVGRLFARKKQKGYQVDFMGYVVDFMGYVAKRSLFNGFLAGF